MITQQASCSERTKIADYCIYNTRDYAFLEKEVQRVTLAINRIMQSKKDVLNR